MAVSAKWYTKGPMHAASDALWGSATVKVALLGAGYTFDQDAHEFFSSVSAQEVAAGAGYTTGGATLGTKTLTSDATSNETRFDAADVAWTVPDGSTLSARYAVVYVSTGTASTSPLLGYVDLGQLTSASASGASATLAIQWDATGILKLTAAA